MQSKHFKEDMSAKMTLPLLLCEHSTRIISTSNNQLVSHSHTPALALLLEVEVHLALQSTIIIDKIIS